MAELRTTCPRDCYDRCGLLATVEAGRVTAIRGDPSSPLSHGRLCAKCRLAYNGVWLDASARLRQPLRRTGPSGSASRRSRRPEVARPGIGRRKRRWRA